MTKTFRRRTPRTAHAIRKIVRDADAEYGEDVVRKRVEALQFYRLNQAFARRKERVRVLERLFEGRLADMVSHLLSHREVSRDELRDLERLIAKKRKGRP